MNPPNSPHSYCRTSDGRRGDHVPKLQDGALGGPFHYGDRRHRPGQGALGTPRTRCTVESTGGISEICFENQFRAWVSQI